MNCFFIGGAARTGGTLLNGVLCSDQTTNPLLRETHHFREVVRLYCNGKQTFEAREKRHYFSTVEELRAIISVFGYEFLRRTLERYPPSTNLVVKSFPLTTMFPDLHELIPEAKFVISVRDPRDTIASQIAVGKRLESAGERNQFPRNILKLAREYNRHYLPTLECANPDFTRQLLFVKYESLTRQPEMEIERIRRFTGLALHGADAVTCWSRSNRDFREEYSGGDPFLTEHYGQRITPSRIGRYREVLTSREIRLLDAECAVIYERFGYFPSGGNGQCG